MGVRAVPRDLRQVYSWRLELGPDFDVALFQECDSPESEFEKTEFSQAGAIHSTKIPGIRKFSDITFRKGMLLDSTDTALYDWFAQAGNTDDGTALPMSLLKRDVDLIHLDGSGNEIDRWTLVGAWISKVSMEKLVGGKSDVLFETGTITYDRYERTSSSSSGGGGGSLISGGAAISIDGLGGAGGGFGIG